VNRPLFAAAAVAPVAAAELALALALAAARAAAAAARTAAATVTAVEAAAAKSWIRVADEDFVAVSAANLQDKDVLPNLETQNEFRRAVAAIAGSPWMAAAVVAAVVAAVEEAAVVALLELAGAALDEGGSVVQGGGAVDPCPSEAPLAKQEVAHHSAGEDPRRTLPATAQAAAASQIRQVLPRA